MLHKKIIEMRFNAPLHIGTNRADYVQCETMLHSDKLYAAIMQAWSLLGCSAWIPENETDDLGFVLSSAFPFSNNAYFLPRICKRFSSRLSIAQTHRKEIKKIAWLDTAFFKEECQTADGCSFGAGHLKGKYLTLQNIDKDFLETSVEPRVMVPRDDSKDAEPYYLERLYFKDSANSGFYCIFEGTDTAFERLKIALDILQYEGIGTDRSTGNGTFTVTYHEEHSVLTMLDDLQQNTETDYAVNLSLWLPDKPDTIKSFLPENDENCAYELVQRGGWVTTEKYHTYKKKSAFFFKEGSVLKTVQRIHGHTIDLRPNIMSEKTTHPVWRVGKSLFVPVIF
jgi:CRISPR type III-A-associated RAMP protein Csm4